jgi:hypothetical protein
MINLRKTDGTERHLRAILHHAQQCRMKSEEPFFQTMMKEGYQVHSRLKNNMRLLEDTLEEVSNLTTDVNGAELTLEDAVRNTRDTASSLDRSHPELGILDKLFPKGSEEIIRPDGKKQIPGIIALRQRMLSFVSLPEIKSADEKLLKLLTRFEAAIQAKDAALKMVLTYTEEDLRLREEVRDQIAVASGRLKERFKNNNRAIESFFHPDPREGSSILSDAEERGIVKGKIEVLFAFIEYKEWKASEEQQGILLAIKDSDTADIYLNRVFEGQTLEKILAPLEEEPAETMTPP